MKRFWIVFIYFFLFIFLGTRGIINILNDQTDNALYNFIGSTASLVASIFLYRVIRQHKSNESIFKYFMRTKYRRDALIASLVPIGFSIGVFAFGELSRNQVIFFLIGFILSFLAVIHSWIYCYKLCNGGNRVKKDFILAGMLYLVFSLIFSYWELFLAHKHYVFSPMFTYLVFGSFLSFFEGITINNGSLKNKLFPWLGLIVTIFIMLYSYVLHESPLFIISGGTAYGLIALVAIKTTKFCEKCSKSNPTLFNKAMICSNCHAKLDSISDKDVSGTHASGLNSLAKDTATQYTEICHSCGSLLVGRCVDYKPIHNFLIKYCSSFIYYPNFKYCPQCGVEGNLSIATENGGKRQQKRFILLLVIILLVYVAILSVTYANNLLSFVLLSCSAMLPGVIILVYRRLPKCPSCFFICGSHNYSVSDNFCKNCGRKLSD